MSDNLSNLLREICSGTPKQLTKRAALFRKGEATNAIYSIEQGQVRLVRPTQDGNVAVIHIGLGGETFAEAALFSDVYHCDAIADEDSEIIVYDSTIIRNKLEKDSKLSMLFIQCLAKQVQQLRAISEIRNIRSAKDRIMEYFKYLAYPHKEFVLTGSFKDCACRLSLTHETFYRKLAELEKEALVTRQGLRIILSV